ncbi:hypothetical protein [Bifidobacterium leontopitheci]|uniref:Uncharacterized protein n=1 Tax=Bifidobacterium leontopitheci TaxID=2650774 RepID=A0A6I1GLN2_9BIFI|nr:hypothetical protein [Bifidobacterium leontopitheci]KAB7790277.1 hypothetical protein F7D09_1173 [Bifidobacterium leontopitheci]
MTITPPQTYAQWMDVIDALAAGGNDDTVIAAMNQGTLVWQSGVSERFVQHLIEAINQRLSSAADRFAKAQSRARSERDVIQSLLDLRKNLATLAQAGSIPAIPEPYRSQIRGLVVQQANDIQNTLERSAATVDRTGRMAHIIRTHPVNTL